MGRKFKDNAATTLAQAITAAATTLQVTAGKGDNFPAVLGHGAAGSAPDFFILTLEDAAANREKIKVEQRAAGSDVLGSVGYPLVRGFDGTVARAWNPGDIADLRVEADDMRSLEDRTVATSAARIFGQKDSTTNGLNFGYFGGVLNVDGAPTVIADGVVALTANQTNYVERTTAGLVTANVVGFSADKVPLHQIVADATGISSIADKRAANDVTHGLLQKNVAAGGAIVLTADEARAPIIEFQGALPNNTTITFPNIKRGWVLRNNTTGQFTLTVKVAGQVGVQLPTGETPIYGNGVDVRPSVPTPADFNFLG
jgi:hypothetical protein